MYIKRKLNRIKKLAWPIALGFAFILLPVVYFTFVDTRAAEAEWFNEGWAYRKKLTIDNGEVPGATDFNDFPVLIEITADADLALHAQTDGDDIIFTALNGEILAYELESYSTGSLTAWVKIPTLYATEDTAFYMYYGNPSATSNANKADVWGRSYKGVWHLEEEQSGTSSLDLYNDSSYYSREGDDFVSATGQTGKIRNGQEFDGSNDYILVGENEKIENTSSGTISAWIYPLDKTTTARTIFGSGGGSTSFAGEFSIYIYDGELGIYQKSDGVAADDDVSTNDIISASNWHYVSITSDGSTWRFYLNGVEQAAPNIYSGSNTGDWFAETDLTSIITNSIGRTRSNNVWGAEFYGYIDEVRITSDTLSEDWLRTEFNNQNDPSTFFSTGTQEMGPGPVGYWALDEGIDNTCPGNAKDICDNSASRNDGFLGTTRSASASKNTITTVTDEGEGGFDASWRKRIVHDPNNNRWHIFYIDSDSDIHSQSTSDTDGLSWTDGIDLTSTKNYDYDNFSCTANIQGGTTYVGCVYAAPAENILNYRRCTLTGTAPYISCNSEQTIASVTAADDIAYPDIAIDSNNCALVVADYEDDSAADADEHEIWLWKEATTCGDGIWSNESGFPIQGIQSEAGYADSQNEIPVGIQSFGDLDAQIFYLDTDAGGSVDLETNFFDGDTNTISGASQVTLSSDIEWDATLGRMANYYSVIAGEKSIAFGMDDNTTDLDAFIISTKGGSGVTQVDTNINSTTTSEIGVGTVTAIVDTNATGGDDIWVFAVDNTNIDKIKYNTSSDGGSTWGASVSDFVDISPDDEIKFLTATYNEDNCDIMVSWLGDDVTPWSVDSKVINTGSCSATEPTWQPPDKCLSEKCLFFDGQNDAAVIPNADSIDLDIGLKDAFTFSTWVKVTSDGESNQGEIFRKGTNTYLRVSNEDSAGYVDLEASLDLPTDATLAVSDALELDKWHYVVISYSDDSDDEISMYIDGSLVGTSANGVGSPGADAYDINLGGDSSNNFHGFIDEFKIYPYERSLEEVKADFSGVGTSIGATQSQQDSGALSEKLVGYWKFNESSGNALDSSGNEFTLINNASAAYSYGKFGNSLELNGTSQFFDLSDNNKLSITSDMTLAAWIEPDDTSGSQSIVGKFDGSNESYLLALEGSNLRMYIDSSANYVTTTSNPITANVLTHVAGVFDVQTQEVKLYVNGIQMATTTNGTIPTSIADDSGEFTIGAEDSSGGASNFFDGKIDEVRIYARKLESNEISNIYNWAPEPNIYFNFDENNGTEQLFDRSGNGYNAQLSGITEAGWKPGKYGSSLSFDGTSYATLGSEGSDLTTNVYAASAWVYSTTDQGNVSIIDNRDADNDGWGMHIDGTSDNVQCSYNALDAVSSTALEQNTWYHVACVADGTSIRVYINAQEENSTAQSGSITESTNLRIAAPAYTTSGAFVGRIDEVRIYDYARTESQIIEDLNGGHPVGGSPVGSQLAFWNFDELGGQNINNTIAGGVFGTLGSSSGSDSADPAWADPTNCKVNACLNFDGSGDYIDFNDNYDFGDGENFTITGWFSRETYTTDDTIIAKKNDKTGNTAGYILWIDDASDKLVVQVSDGGGGFDHYTFESENTFTNSDWHHFAIVFDDGSGTNTTIYIDGVQAESAVSSGVLANTASLENANDLRIGAESDGGDPFDGFLDEIKIYNTTLTQEQVRIDMNTNAAIAYSTGSTENDTVIGGWGDIPVVYYPFDENTGTTTVYDKSGNLNDGTMNGSMTEADWVRGKSGSALDFDGSDDYIDSGINSHYAQSTYMAWVYPRSVGETFGRIFDKRQAGAETVTLYTAATERLQFIQQFSSNAGNWYTDNNTLTYNQWSHIAVVYDNSGTSNDPEIYINGILQDLTEFSTPSGTASTNSDNYIIGNRGNQDRSFDGYIDEVKIYDYLMTPAQISYEFNRGAPVGWWQLDECQGTTANDASGKGNTGSISAGASGGNTSAGICNSGNSNEMWNNGSVGVYNAGLDFDGSDDVITIANNNTLDFDNALRQEFSFAAWFRAESDGENNTGRIFDKNSNTFLGVANQGTTDLDLQASLNLSGTDATVSITDAINTNEWVHVVLTYSDDADDEISIFINGNLITTSTNGVGNPNTTDNAPLYIGGNTSTNFEGQIDDVRIYNYELSEDQIRNILNEGAGVRYGPNNR